MYIGVIMYIDVCSYVYGCVCMHLKLEECIWICMYVNERSGVGVVVEILDKTHLVI